MKRRPSELQARQYDVLIVGGGITGACLAFDAALRGLAVALIDKGDFGAATSAASSKLLHGGLRYLQQLRFDKVRESALERVYFQNLAPHLTHYVPFVVPTYRGVARSKTLLNAGMLLYAALCAGQQRLIDDPSKRVPVGRGLSREQVLARIPGLDTSRLTGGRLFFESHMRSSERMTLAFIDSAARAGAVVVNYIKAERFLVDGDRVLGVEAADCLEGADAVAPPAERNSGHPSAGTFEIRASVVVNAAGPWIRRLNAQLETRRVAPILTGVSKGAHIVTRSLTDDCAVALPTRRPSQSVIDRGGRHVFIIPWCGHSLIGTTYGPFHGDLDDLRPTTDDAEELIEEINSALGPGTLSLADVRYAFAGLYPLVDDEIRPAVYQGTGEYRVVDHQDSDGVVGLFSVFGAKYTTARLLAERAVDRIAARLGKNVESGLTRKASLASGDIPDIEQFRAHQRERHAALSAATIDHLVDHYGAACDVVAALAQSVDGLADVLVADRSIIAAEAVWAARSEMACHLDDFVFRRSGLGTLGHPGSGALDRTASLMGAELGWDPGRRAAEIERVERQFPDLAANVSPPR